MPWPQQVTMFLSVVVPVLGLVAAIVLMWHRGPGSVGWAQVVAMVCMYALAGYGVTVGFHRLLTHKSFETPRALRLTLAICGSIAGQGAVIRWCATHRRHHQTSDQQGDPHSPHLFGDTPLALLRGIWHSHMGWLFNHELTDWGTYVRDLLHDRLIFKLNRMYFLWITLGLVLPAIAEGLITMSWLGFTRGFLWGGLIRVLVVHHTTWSINSVCHVFGSQPYQVKDHSTNNVVLAIPTFGESWHNNHHAFPSSAVHGLEWWQVDITGSMIKLCAMLGLASAVKVAKKKQPEIDLNQKSA
jgi:stearoyl-CoA desaturase (delta-9 desaturase)